jgi:hypothetical protein
MKRKSIISIAAVFVLVVAVLWCAKPSSDGQGDLTNGRARIPVVFSKGHETNPVDHGRPVTLIGPVLGVSPEIFREAFSRVRPARAGMAPSHNRVMENKKALMRVLAPHRVTNERLDTASNYYRYNRSRGEMWPTDSATAYALVHNGEITGFEITDGGSGYSSRPIVTVPGVNKFAAEVQMSFSQQFDKNGSVTAITLMND